MDILKCMQNTLLASIVFVQKHLYKIHQAIFFYQSTTLIYMQQNPLQSFFYFSLLISIGLDWRNSA